MILNRRLHLGLAGLAGLAGLLPAAAWGQSASDIIDAGGGSPAVEAQLQGDYGSLDRNASLPLGVIQEAWDDAGDDAGVYRVAYSPDRVMRVRVRDNMPVTIVLPEWERIGSYVVGDDYVFTATVTGPNMVVVDAVQVGADATLTIVGQVSRRVYAFYLRAEGAESANVSDVVVYVEAAAPVAVTTPPTSATEGGPGDAAGTGSLDPAAAQAAASSSALHDPDYLEEIPFDAAELRFDFDMTGDPSIAPNRVFSDGVFTYFDWGARWDSTDVPAIYRVIDDIDVPQNARYRGSMIIVEATGAFTLRNGKRVVCVRPEGWDPATEPSRTRGADGGLPRTPKGA